MNNSIANLHQVLNSLLVWVEQLGPWGAIAFIGLYIVATVAFLPGTFLTLGAGVLFGWIAGSFYVFVGATLGAIVAFWVGRYLVRGWVSRKIAGNPKFAAVDRTVGTAGFKIVLLTRLSPLFPFNLLNYTFGITQVSLRDYVLGSVGMVPGTLMYVYIGSLAGSLASLGTGSLGTGSLGTGSLGLGTGNQATDSFKLLLQGLGLVATVTVTLYITRIARKALNECMSESEC